MMSRNTCVARRHASLPGPILICSSPSCSSAVRLDSGSASRRHEPPSLGSATLPRLRATWGLVISPVSAAKTSAVMGKAKKTRKFAEVKRMLNPKDARP